MKQEAQVLVRIPKSLRRDLDQIKKTKGISIQAQVTFAIQSWVADQKPEKSHH